MQGNDFVFDYIHLRHDLISSISPYLLLIRTYYLCFSFLYIQKKILPNNGVLLKGVLIDNWLNNPEASNFLINLDFLLLHTARRTIA